MPAQDALAFRILVAEDDFATREWLKRALVKKGYDVTAVEDGEEALDAAKQGKYQLAIVDLLMPRKSGLETMAALKASDPAIEVILVTGHTSKTVASEAMSKGAYAYLIKPFDLSELEALLPSAYEKTSLKALVGLFEATRSVFADVHLEDLLQDLMGLACKILGAEEASLMLRGEDGALRLSVSSNPAARGQKDIKVALGESVAGRVAQWKTGVTIEGNLQSDPRFADLPSRDGVQHSLVYPILLKDELIGILCANRREIKERFQAHDLRHATLFCSHVAQAIENAKLYGKLQAARNEALKANALKDEFLYITTHDLKTPLGIIQGYTEQMLKNDDKPDLRKELGARVLHNIDAMLALIQQILRKGQLEAGQFRLDKKPVAVDALVDECLRDFQVLAAKKSIKLEKQSRLEAGYQAHMDPGAFREILSNLIGNAIKFCESGDAIIVGLRRSTDGFLVVNVADTGPGISEDDRRRLFQRFQRGRSATAEGTGFGLNIVKTLVELHGGKVDFASGGERGSVFTVTLLDVPDAPANGQ